MVALVGRLVEAEPGLAVAARVPLAGAGVDRLARRVVRVDGDASRSRSSGCPPRPASSAASSRGRCSSARRRRRRRRRRACSCRCSGSWPIVTAVSRPDHCVGLMNDCVPNLSTSSVSGPIEVPLREGLRALLLELVVRLDRALDLARRDLRGGIRTVGVRLSVRPVRGAAVLLLLERCSRAPDARRPASRSQRAPSSTTHVRVRARAPSQRPRIREQRLCAAESCHESGPLGPIKRNVDIS